MRVKSHVDALLARLLALVPAWVSLSTHSMSSVHCIPHLSCYNEKTNHCARKASKWSPLSTSIVETVAGCCCLYFSVFREKRASFHSLNTSRTTWKTTRIVDRTSGVSLRWRIALVKLYILSDSTSQPTEPLNDDTVDAADVPCSICNPQCLTKKQCNVL